MKRIIVLLAICLGFTAVSSAQDDTKPEPGIYAVVNGVKTLLPYTNGVTANTSTNIVGIGIGNRKYTYKGETAGVQAKDTLIMVINPEQKNIKRTPKVYEPFIATMNPNSILIVPLEVKKGKRSFNEGLLVAGIQTEKKTFVSFDWELVDENTFQITAQGMKPGEYGVVFKPAKLGSYDLSAIFGFCVAEE